MRKPKLNVRRTAMDAVMVALYILISTLFVINAGALKITIEGLPIIIIAMIFGPLHAALVGFLGEFLNQLLTFGLTPTTLLWVAPSVVRGLVVGFGMIPLRRLWNRKPHPACEITPLRRSVMLAGYFGLNLLSAVLVSLTNTFTWYVDSKLFGYYEYHTVFGMLGFRIGTGLICTAIMALLAIPVVLALKRAKLVK